MTLYNPGRGLGPAMHIRRVRALQDLERSGLLTFHSYTADGGYRITTAAGEVREIGAAELAPYIAGMSDLYCSIRRTVDEAAGEEALDQLDNSFLDVLNTSLAAVLPPTGDAP